MFLSPFFEIIEKLAAELRKWAFARKSHFLNSAAFDLPLLNLISMNTAIDFSPLLPDLSGFLIPLTGALPWLPALFLGLGLAASSGLRAFLPLLLLSAVFKWNFLGMTATPHFAWLASDTAFFALLCATLIEIAGDKIPLVDHTLDTVATLVRPAAGALSMVAVLNASDPTTAALLGLILGAPLALGVHAAKAGTRGASTLATAGIANPALSVVEDIAALFVGVLSFAMPLLVPLLLVFAAILVGKMIGIVRRFKATRANAGTAAQVK